MKDSSKEDKIEQGRLHDEWRIFKAYSRICVIALIGTIVSLLSFLLMLNHNMNNLEQQFRHEAATQILSLEHKINILEQFWGDLQVFYSASQELSAESFEHFSLSILKRSDLSFISFIPVSVGTLTEDQIYLKTKSHIPKESIREFLIQNSIIRETIEEAKISRKVTSSIEFELPFVAMPEEQKGLAVVVPVFAKNGDISKKSAAGYVVSFLETKPFFKHVFQLSEEQENQKNMSIYLKDPAEGQKHLIFKHQSNHDLAPEFTINEFPQYEPAFRVSRSLAFGSETLEIVIAPSFAYQAQSTTGGVWAVLFLGMTLTASFAYWFHQQIKQNLEIERVVNERTKALQESNQELDDFVYVVSHDLKEPLRGLYSYSQFLQEDYADKLDAAGKEKLNMLKTLSIRMEELINTLLYYSRLGRSEEAFKETDLNRVLKKTLELLDPVITKEKADIQIDDKLPTISCDRAHIGDIFRNLIVNALKYNDSDHKIVKIGYDMNNEEYPNSMVFYVEDNGIGIEEKHHEAIFKMFKRLHGRNAYGGGTGSGLAIVKKIVDRHNGEIWIKSNKDGGSTFYFILREHA